MSQEKTVKTLWWQGNDLHIITMDEKYVVYKEAREVSQEPTVYRDDAGNVVMTETPIPIPADHLRVQVEDDMVCHDCMGCIPKGTFALQTPLGLMHDYCVEESGKAHRDELTTKGG